MLAGRKTDVESPQGLDLTALGAWLTQKVPELSDPRGELSASLITGGKSNLTYLVTDGVNEFVVRRPPLGHVLATAHDMAREYRVMSALSSSAVPVPTMHGLCEDDSVLGAPFYVMEKVTGTAYQVAAELEKLGPEPTRALSEKLVNTLAELHAVDYRSLGLSDFGRPNGYLERQVARWRKQLASSRSRDIAGIDELAERLAVNVPASSDGTIVHGDYRLDNVLFDESGTMTAVLDWEMSTLGDPLTDLAVLLAYQQIAEVSPTAMAGVTNASTAAGYLARDQIVELYATVSGRDVTKLGFHLGLAFFKLAVILEGIYFRHSKGQTVGSGFETIGAMIEPLVAAGLDATTT